MHSLIGLKDQFDVAFGPTRHDRHGVVAKSVWLLPPNQLSDCVHSLPVFEPARLARRPRSAKPWCSSSAIDCVAGKLGRKLYEVPVGFKWFVDGLLNGWLAFGGEDGAGASFLRRNGAV